jgi:2,3-bisphosphoglycerate-independent phosphoglycerate mutase
MKVLLVILDGLGDRTAPELEYKTPLQLASTPNLDELASLGMNGLMYPLSPGIAPATELAHFVLFGYSLLHFPGRAVFEAVGEGLDLNDKDVVLRASFASVEERGESLVVVDRVIGTEEEILSKLSEEISQKKFGNINFEFVYNSKRQGILFLKGGAAKEITDSDPFANNKPVIRVEAFEEAKEFEKATQTAECLNQFLKWVYHRLNEHPLNKERRSEGLRPINFLVTKWAGLRRKLPSFYEMQGFKGATVSSGPMFEGLASEIGLDYLKAHALDDPTEDLNNRFRLAKDTLSSEYDFVHVHTKAPDEAAHTKDPLLKVKIIEKLDHAFSLLFSDDFIRDDILIVVTSDHCTPSSGFLIHSGEPVPIMLIGQSVRRDDVREFNELACLNGALGQIAGCDLMNVILNFTNRIKYFGSRLTSKNVSYYPVDINFLEKEEHV